MPSLRSNLFNATMRVATKRRLAKQSLDAASIDASRRRLDALGRFARLPSTMRRESTDLGGVPVEWTRVADPEGVIYYCHGGAYMLGSPRAYRRFLKRLAERSRRDVAAIEYRLAPEHRFPAAPDDALVGYRALLDSGYDARDVAFAGDSAGGNLALVTLLRCKAEGLPVPASAALLSPWTDMTASGPSYVANRDADPMLPAHRIVDAARLYAGDVDLDHEWLSPVRADLSGLPRLLVLVGSIEILLDDAVSLVERAKAAGVAAHLAVWPGMPHAFPVFADVLPEARRAIDDVADFIRSA